ncbi:serum response factor-binding protein 1-like [Galleria mellonella]|uniref:Serum response factor-binding protein 1-like n=1 Tax=Galleria mellonella TaxID=7137 RepID=A0A6J1WFY1_GALME|nr:serum response factor-binding protein 1-like [Galleria mellonella]
MWSLIFFALLSAATAKPRPGGLISPWSAPSYSPVSVVQQPTVAVAQPAVVAQPYVHAAPVIAKPAATSYASFQQIVHPVSVAQPVVHAAPVISQPVVHAPIVSQPVVQTVAQPVVQAPIIQQPVVQAPIIQQPVVQTIAQPVVQKYLSVGSVGHGW